MSAERIRVMILRPNLEKEITTMDNSYESLVDIIKNRFQMAPVYTGVNDMDIIIYADEEGKLNNSDITAVYNYYGKLADLRGNLVFTGSDGYGESLSLTDEQVKFLEDNLITTKVEVINEGVKTEREVFTFREVDADRLKAHGRNKGVIDMDAVPEFQVIVF